MKFSFMTLNKILLQTTLTNIKILIENPQILLEDLNVGNHNMDNLNMVNRNSDNLNKLHLNMDHLSLAHLNFPINSMLVLNMSILNEVQ
jgi:hypothetical protein